MAPSATLEIFVPPVGESNIQDTPTGGTVFTTNEKSGVDSWIFPDGSGKTKDLDIKGAPTGETDVNLFGRTKDVSYLGNADDNTSTFTGKSRDLEVDMGGGADEVTTFSKAKEGFFSLGEGDNKFTAADKLKGSFVSSGSGDDDIKVFGKTIDSTLLTGEGADSLIFGSEVKGSNIFLGKGADKVTFTGEVEDTYIDLGGDKDIDTIIVGPSGELGEGVRITGASEGDQLIIGGHEYEYDESEQAFINDIDETINFG